MVRFTLIIPKALNNMLIILAKLNHRSKNAQIQHMLEELAKKEMEESKKPS